MHLRRKVRIDIKLRTELIHNLLSKILTRDISVHELNKFISYCQAISKTCVIYEIRHGRLNLDQALSSKDQLDSFALDCIADLFARDDENDLFLFRRVFEHHFSETDVTPEMTTIKLRTLISSRVHQALISLFSRVDHGGWNIWRNLSLVTTRNKDIQEFSYLTKCYYFFNDKSREGAAPESLSPNGEKVCDELLSDWLRISLKENKGMPRVILNVFQILKKHPEYQQFLERGRLYYFLKRELNISYTDGSEIDTLTSQSGPGEEGNFFQSQGALAVSLKRYVIEMLDARYIEKGKISEQLSQKYLNILELYFSDLISDGYVDKLQSYVETCQHQHLLNDEWLQHRARLEYLIRLGKKWLQENLNSDEFLRASQMNVYS